MADSVQKVIEIIFKGNDQLSDITKNVSSAFGGIEAGVQKIAQPLAGVADGILGVDAALTALAVGGLTLALKKSIEFESSLIELQKVVGDQPAALDAAKQAAFELSDKYGESAGDILLSTADFKQAGFNISDSLTLTKDALDLVIAGGLGASESSKLLVSTLKGFKAPASEAARLVDILNEVSNNYATDVQQLAIGMAGLSPIASKMGFSFEETAGVLTPVIEVFRSGSEASIALKTGLLRLIDDSAPVQEALKQLGVSQKDANKQLRSGKDILADVGEAFKSANQNQKLFLAKELVGIQQSARMVEVFDGMAKSAEITAVALDAAGSAAKEVAARLQSAEVAVRRFQQGFNNLAISVGDEFRKAAVEAIDGATEIENALRDLVSAGTFDPLFKLLREFSTDLGQFLSEVATALPDAFKGVDFGPLLDAINSLRESFGSFFDELDLTKPEDLSTAIQFVVDSLESLITVTEGMVDGFKPFIDGLLSTIEGFNKLDDAAQKDAGAVLAAAKVIVSAGTQIAFFLIAIGDNADAASRVFNLAFGAIKVAINATQVAFDVMAGIVVFGLALINKALAAVTFGDLSRSFKKTGEDLDRVLRGVADNAGRNFSDMAEGAARFGSAFSDAEGDARSLAAGIATLPDKKEVKVEIETIEAKAAFDELVSKLKAEEDFEIGVDVTPIDPAQIAEVKKGLEAIPDTKTVEVQLNIDPDSSFEEDFREIVGEDGIKRFEIVADFSTDAESAAKLDEEIEALKEPIELETKLKGLSPEDKKELETLKIKADTVQDSLEWTAKIQLAEIDASGKAFDALASTFESIGVSVEAVSGNVSDMFSEIANAPELSADLFTRSAFQEAQANQALLIASQIELNTAQKAFLLAKASALQSGDALITITADGLEPELEAFMWPILERIQIRANESISEFLLGL